MGLIFSKKKKNQIIRKNDGRKPKVTSNHSEKNFQVESEKSNLNGQTQINSNPSQNNLTTLNSSQNKTTGNKNTPGPISSPVISFGHNIGSPKKVDSYASIPKEMVIKKITTPNATPISFGVKNGDSSVSQITIEENNKQVSENIPVIADTPDPSQYVDSSEFGTLDRVVNYYGISFCLFNFTRAMLSATEWDDPLLIQLLNATSTELNKEVKILKNIEVLKDWVHPLHYRKTGSILGAGKVLASNHRYVLEPIDKLIQTGGNGFGYSDQRQLKESLKEMLKGFVNFINCCEMSVPSDFASEINELARTVRDVVDTASGKLDYVYDDVARICTTCSIRLGMLSLWKATFSKSIIWNRQMSDTCFTIAKASKVLYQVGRRLLDNQDDTDAQHNLNVLTKGIFVQMKKLQTIIHQEPNEQKTNNYSFTSENIAEHLVTYEQGMKEVQSSLSNFLKNNTEDTMVIEATETILQQVEAIKITLQNPDVSSLIFAVANMSESIEKFCGSIYYALHQVSDEYEVIREQLMETMQLAVHCVIQLQLVACSRGLNCPVVNPELTLLNSLRSLLLAASIVIEGVDYLKKNNLIVHDAEAQSLMTKEDINEALIYILHYGRSLFRGDEEIECSDEESEDDINEVKAVVNSNTLKSISSPNLSKEANVSSTNPQVTSTNSFNRESTSIPTIKQSETPPPKPIVEDPILETDPDLFNDENLPPGFEPPPPKPVYKQNSSEEEYKKFMMSKYEYETWENKLLLYKMKMKKQIEELKAKNN